MFVSASRLHDVLTVAAVSTAFVVVLSAESSVLVERALGTDGGKDAAAEGSDLLLLRSFSSLFFSSATFSLVVTPHATAAYERPTRPGTSADDGTR